MTVNAKLLEMTQHVGVFFYILFQLNSADLIYRCLQEAGEKAEVHVNFLEIKKQVRRVGDNRKY